MSGTSSQYYMEPSELSSLPLGLLPPISKTTDMTGPPSAFTSSSYSSFLDRDKGKKKKKRQAAKLNAQAQLYEFWSQYHFKKPAKITSIFPRKLYEGLVPVDDTPGPRVRNAAKSYDEVRAKCKDLVRRAVAECERTNAKYTDAEFDVDKDFMWRANNCLYGLDRDSRELDFSRFITESVSGMQLGRSLETLSRSRILAHDSVSVNVTNLRRALEASGSFISNFDLESLVNRPKSVRRLDWIFENPQFTVDGFSSGDIMQGRGGDCWWLAGLSSIAHRRDLMDKICVARDEDCGVYGFVFWRDGEWICTVIDDNLYLKHEDWGRLRTSTFDATGKKARLYRKEKQTGSKALYFSRCEDENETWLPLLEKAYAKVHGDYSAIDGGWSGIAIEDMTGGVTTMIMGNHVLRKDRLWRELTKSGGEQGEFVFALSAVGSSANDESKNGIVLGHAYSIIKATEILDEEGNKHRLIKIRNPWGERSHQGNGVWFGPWSDGSCEWTPYMIQKLGHKFGDNGTFWMSFQDVLDHFKWIHRTRLFDERWTIAQAWTSSRVSWVTGYLSRKFTFEVKKSGMVVVVLCQLDDRYFKGLHGQYRFTLEFILRKTGDANPLCQVQPSHNRLDTRSINCELDLEAGNYEVLPKITAKRISYAKTIGQVVKANADKNPEKLRQVGMQYDLAHAKIGVIDEDDALERLRVVERKKKLKKKKKEKARKQEEKRMRMFGPAFSYKMTKAAERDVTKAAKKTVVKKLEKHTSTSDGESGDGNTENQTRQNVQKIIKKETISTNEKDEVKNDDHEKEKKKETEQKQGDGKKDEENGEQAGEGKDEEKCEDRRDESEEKENGNKAEKQDKTEDTKLDEKRDEKVDEKKCKKNGGKSDGTNTSDRKTKDNKNEIEPTENQDKRKTAKEHNGAEDNIDNPSNTESSSSEDDTPSTSKYTTKDTTADNSDSTGSTSDSSLESDSDLELDMEAKRPWDAVCVIGLRVYAMDSSLKVVLEEKKKEEEEDVEDEKTEVEKMKVKS